LFVRCLTDNKNNQEVVLGDGRKKKVSKKQSATLKVPSPPFFLTTKNIPFSRDGIFSFLSASFSMDAARTNAESARSNQKRAFEEKKHSTRF